ncbi:MAG TPA: P1 family peptidase [Rhizomicrobium sp.]|nr:P1 family peptidase [Rhizomicrobium sp.]
MDRRSLLASLSLGAAAMASGARVAMAQPQPVPIVRPRPAAEGGPGPRNLITDVPGLQVGQAEDPKARTGVSVILPDARATCSVDVRGGGPGTRETDALNSWNLVHSVDAVVLSGGSVYGLGTADGVAAWLGAQGRGYQMAKSPGVPPSPIVPAAILYDLANHGNKEWGLEPPYRKLGIRAVETASQDFKLGTAGAGYGAEAGSLKGGTGSASYVSKDGIAVGAIVAVNCLGSVIVPGTKNFWAGAFEVGNEFGGLGATNARVVGEDWGLSKANPAARANTTIACIATDVELTIDQMKRITMMAQDGLARAIRPIHSPFDGDVVFGLSTGKQPMKGPLADYTVARIGSMAADVLSRAVARGVYEATLPPGMEGKTWHNL